MGHKGYSLEAALPASIQQRDIKARKKKHLPARKYNTFY